MKKEWVKWVGICAGTVLLFSGGRLWAAEEGEARPEVKLQTTCPVMGGEINKGLFVDHNGKRIYVCCGGCIETIKKDPEKYIKQIEDKGITLDATPVELCTKCGEIKGADECCKAEGREACAKCGLFKGSPGCCKISKDAKEPAVVCPKCGEVKGADACCKKEGHAACPKCSLHQGSPGCCRMKKEAPSETEPKGEKVAPDAKKEGAQAPVGRCGGCGGGRAAEHVCNAKAGRRSCGTSGLECK